MRKTGFVMGAGLERRKEGSVCFLDTEEKGYNSLFSGLGCIKTGCLERVNGLLQVWAVTK